MDVIKIDRSEIDTALGLDRVYEELNYLLKDEVNPRVKSRLKNVMNQVYVLMNDVDYLDKKYIEEQVRKANKPKVIQKKKPIVHHQAPMGRNAIRKSRLHNEQGIFDPKRNKRYDYR